MQPTSPGGAGKLHIATSTRTTMPPLQMSSQPRANLEAGLFVDAVKWSNVAGSCIPDAGRPLIGGAEPHATDFAGRGGQAAGLLGGMAVSYE